MYGIDYAAKAAALADPVNHARSPQGTKVRLEAAAVYAQLAMASALAGQWANPDPEPAPVAASEG